MARSSLFLERLCLNECPVFADHYTPGFLPGVVKGTCCPFDNTRTYPVKIPVLGAPRGIIGDVVR